MAGLNSRKTRHFIICIFRNKIKIAIFCFDVFICANNRASRLEQWIAPRHTMIHKCNMPNRNECKYYTTNNRKKMQHKCVTGQWEVWVIYTSSPHQVTSGRWVKIRAGIMNISCPRPRAERWDGLFTTLRICIWWLLGMTVRKRLKLFCNLALWTERSGEESNTGS